MALFLNTALIKDGARLTSVGCLRRHRCVTIFQHSVRQPTIKGLTRQGVAESKCAVKSESKAHPNKVAPPSRSGGDLPRRKRSFAVGASFFA